jgi:hypothetical protein
MTAGELMKQAGMTAAEYMRAAMHEIDEAFGPGFAKANPALVGAYMQTAAADFATMWFTQHLERGLDDLGGGLDRIAKAIAPDE